jgi:hypothetical protein
MTAAVDVDDLLKTHAKLAAERVNFDSLNQEVAEFVLPEHANFTTLNRMQGDKRAQKQYDATAPTEAWRHAAAIDSLASPAGEKWDGLAALDERLNERDDVQQYFDDVMDVVRAERQAQEAEFQSSIFDVWRLGGVLGTTALTVADRIGGGLRYRAMPTSEIYVMPNAWGRVCELHRKWKLTAKAALLEYGEDVLPQKIKDAAASDQTRTFEFLQCIKANDDRRDGYLDARSMPWLSYEVAIEDKVILRQGGYGSWPMPVYRYNVMPNEWYGRGWAAEVLPEIKLLNRARKAYIRQVEKAADPPLLLHEDGLLNYGSAGVGQTPSLAAGSLNHNAVNADGKPLVVPLFTGADLTKSIELQQQCQRTIKDAALTSLFQILVDRERMTATEWLGIMQEKGQLIGPMIGRSVTTFLAQVQEREIEVLARQGKLPQMPRALQRVGGAYKTQFNSPLIRLMKLREVLATQQWLADTILPYMELKPDLLDIPDWEKIARDTARGRGVPASFVTDKGKLEEMRQQRAAQAATQQMVEAAPQVAGAMKDIAQAGAITRDAEIGRAVQSLRGALRSGQT